jgi:hypothetical protein
MKFVFIFIFNMDIRWMYSNLIFSIICIQPSMLSDIIRIRKNKVRIEAI